VLQPADAERLDTADRRAMLAPLDVHDSLDAFTKDGRTQQVRSRRTTWRRRGQVAGILCISRIDALGTGSDAAAVPSLPGAVTPVARGPGNGAGESALAERARAAEAARERAEQTQDQARFLDEASRMLHASLDDFETLRSVTRLIVPRLADRCAVHLLLPDGELQCFPLGEGADEPEEFDLLRRIAQRLRLGPMTVAKTGASELYPEVTDETLSRVTDDPDALMLLHRMNIRSAMVVPMKTSGRVIGTISFFALKSDRRFRLQDLRLAEELARRTALAVENARLYRETQAASRAKSEFLATMSHELRTPLNAISGYTDLLQMGIADPAQQSAHLERIKASTWHLLSVIEEILSFSRLEAGREEVHVQTLDAVKLAHEAAGLVHAAAEQKGLQFGMNLPHHPVPVRTDRLKVRQILTNLLSNAVKFTAEGSVTLELYVEDGQLTFRVGDTGPGIRPEEIDLIYEPFWQAERGTTRRAGGTGIGLTVARQLSDLLGGALRVDSTPGQGTVFSLELPANAPAAD
jgi:signal transduction histidine kinase